MASRRYNMKQIDLFLNYFTYMKDIILNQEEQQKIDVSSDKGTEKIFFKIKKDLMNQLTVMKNIFSFLNSKSENFILIEKMIDPSIVDENWLQSIGIQDQELELLHKINEILNNVQEIDSFESKSNVLIPQRNSILFWKLKFKLKKIRSFNI